MSSVVLAKALYDNDSEADDELSFRKGDVITVLETDFEGMEGWWLCSLGDKQGVAPGNRLQLLSYGTDDVSDDVGDVYDTPGRAHKQKFGDVDYDVPMAHATSQEHEDYAIPKSRYGNVPTIESQRHGFVLPSPRTPKAFDVRNSDSSDGLVTNELYDAPSRWSSERSSDEFQFSGEGYQEIGSEEAYDVPSRNSLESDDGAGSYITPSNPVPPQSYITPSAPKLPPKPSATGQENQDIYDSPASMAPAEITEVKAGYSELDVYDTVPSLPGNNNVKKLNNLFESGKQEGREEIYDVPPAPEDIYDVPPTVEQLPYNATAVAADTNNNAPETGTTELAVNDAIYDEVPENTTIQGGVYDNFEFDGMAKELEAERRQFELLNEQRKSGTGKMAKSEKKEENDDYVDYQEIYGGGKDEPATPTKAGEKRASDVQGSVFDRIHMDKVRELRITHTVAMNNLDKLQQAVDVAVTKLLSFVTEDWRQADVLALNVHSIRDISGKVKVALRLLTEFGLGALRNAEKFPDNGTKRKIRDALGPLLEMYYAIKDAIQSLDESEWVSAYDMREDDELNRITSMAQGIPCDAYKLGAVISNVSALLFSKPPPPAVAPRRKTSSPVPAQKESVKGLDAKKVDSEHVSIHAKQRLVPKPLKTEAGNGVAAMSNGEKPAVSENVTELTNNLLNEIEDMKQSKSTFRRQGSKRLSPKTVRRLCSIGLKNDERSSEKIFEDVSATPPKPSRRCSSPASPTAPAEQVSNARLSTTMSDPDFSATNELQNNDANTLHRLVCFMEKMDSQFVNLKEGIKSFVQSVRQCDKPKVFVAHSKFIVLSAHKLVYLGDGASRSQGNGTAKNTIATVTNALSDVINEFVEGIKQAARQYPDEGAMNAMIKSAASVTEKALELYKTLKNYEDQTS